MSDKPTGAQHNTTRESGVQYITSGGDINVYPPGGPAKESGKGRFTKRPVLLAAAAVVTAAATAITLALLPSAPPARTNAAGGTARAAAGAPAHSTPPVSPVSPQASADSRASSVPESRDAPSTAPAPGLERESAPEPRREDSTPRAAVRHESWSDSYPDGTVCAAADRWTSVPGMTGVDFQACAYAKSYAGIAQFGVKVRNTSNRQVAVAVWVEYWISQQQHDCSSPFPQDHVVIDPGTTWSSQMRNCIRGLKGETHRVQASAGVSEEGGNPRYSRLAPSRGVDVYADGRAVPVAYPS
ncbi:hypothetical protein AB0C81_13040 [Streptomyces roseoverticillatus]|uniref:hypothetical protein n=1 Tax=Streptomyces roseoverticillatus TaxID=66429 RepID=UPI0033D12FE1